ncbi:MAG: transporter [Niabella sp.]|nr:MAG: transporter [Niabella sp.]
MPVFKKPILIFVLLLLVLPALAQEESINTDRPDQSDGVFTLPKKRFQVEDGVTIANHTIQNNLMLRYGLTRSTEIRMSVDAGKNSGVKGLEPLTLSFKQRLVEQKSWLPAITMVGYLSFERLASKGFQGNKIPVDLVMAFENELTNKFSLAYNLGTSNRFKTLNLTTQLAFAPIEKLSTFVEYFSAFSGLNKPEHNMDIGILFAIHPRLQVDLAAGHSIFDADNRLYYTAGLSYLFK